MVRNKSHTLAYSIIGLQELNLCWKYPTIYWNAANLIVDSGSLESAGKNKSTNYGKIATAIAGIQQAGTHIALPVINEAEFSFRVDEINNRIIFGLRGINGVGDELARLLIDNRPYTSMDDFKTRMLDTRLVKPAQMVKLIKAGCFVELDDKDTRKTMNNYINQYLLEPCKKLGMQQFNRIEQFNMIPENMQILARFQKFKKYILSSEFLDRLYIDEDSKRALPKCGYNDRYFKLNDVSMPFFMEHFSEDSVVEVEGEHYVVSEKQFNKEIAEKLEPLAEWFSKPETLEQYNLHLFNGLWDKHANGTVPQWEMDSLSFYYTEHELKNLNEKFYGVSNYFELPEEPEVYAHYTRWIDGKKRKMPKFAITRIAGTVLEKNKDKHTTTILTKYGTVNVKWNKGQFVHYNRTISARLDPNSDKKTTLESSWYKRGNTVLISGYRQGQVFRAYRYADTIYQHCCNLIEQVNEDGTIEIKAERIQI